MKKTIIGVYNRDKNIIMIAEQLIEMENMMKFLTVLALVTVAMLAYLIWLFRKEPPTDVILAPMEIDFEDGTQIRIEPVDPQESLNFKNHPLWDPDRMN